MRFTVQICLVVQILTQLLFTVNCANILFFFTLANYSHRLSVWPLIEALADRGHNVTIFTQYEAKSRNPKVHEFFPKILNKVSLSQFSFVDARYNNIHHSLLTFVLDKGVEFCEKIMADPEVLHWVDHNTYDLVVIDSFVNDCALGMAYKWKAPHIIFSTAAPYNWQYDEMGIVPETSWIPETYSEYPAEMSFIQRLLSTYEPLYLYFYKQWYYVESTETAIRKGLSIPDMPSLNEMYKTVSLVLVDIYFSTEHARSLPPLVVPVGGMQCWKERQNKSLPKDIAKFIEDGGKDGFVYMSLGSGAKIGELHESTQQAILSALKASKTRFIIRWDGEPPKNPPDNVYISSWLPQQELLTHASIKGFITHGGGLSTHEAVCLGVPVIVVPIFGDQDQNAIRLVEQGCGLKLEIKGLTHESLYGAIKKLLDDNSYYRRNMRRASQIFMDRPMNPINLAVWWTEYVLRHKETPLLRPRGMSQTWYQRRLLDVWFVVFAAITLPVIFLVLLLCKLCGKRSSSSNTATNKKSAAATQNKLKKK